MKSRRGIALITTLLMSVILLLLLGALLGVNRSYLQTSKTQQAQQDVVATCLAVYQYALYNLEHDRSWASLPFPQDAVTDASLRDGMKVRFRAGTHEIQGEFASRRSTFEATIENNLQNAGETEDGVPPNCSRITIEASSGLIRKRVVALVRVAPLFDAGALSRKFIRVDSDRLSIESLDPFRNLLRAEEGVIVPDALQAQRTQFRSPATGAPDPYGMVISRGHIFVGNQQLDATNLAEANLNAGGRFWPEADRHFDILDLKPNDIEVPSDELTIPSGEYRFSKVTARVDYLAYRDHRSLDEGQGIRGTAIQEIDVLEYYENPPAEGDRDATPDKIFRSKTRLDDLNILIGQSKDSDGQKPEYVDVQRVTLQDPDGYTPPWYEMMEDWGQAQGTVAEVTDVFNLVSSDDGNVEINLAEQTVSVSPGITVTTENDLIISSTRGKPPLLDLGEPSNPPALVAKGGSLKLTQAITTGVGSLVARDGNVELSPISSEPDASTGLSINTSNNHRGLVVYASEKVKMKNLGQGGSWSFEGLVYGREGFVFEANQADAKFDGSVVALNGDLTVENAADVTFLYNPDHLQLLSQDLPQNRVQLEKVAWRE